MDGVTFDRLTKVAVQSSRRAVLRALIGIVMTANLDPGRDTRAQSGGLVVLGGTCTTTADCEQDTTPSICPLTAVCGDNGFPSDGPLTCCTETCCLSDADCCGDMRCAFEYELHLCRHPPFPTRAAGQICTSNSDCFHFPGCFAECVNQRCKCTVVNAGSPNPTPQPISDEEAALAAVEELSALEATGQFDALYDRMHPDAQRVVPRAAVVGWYREAFAPRGPQVAEAIKVRLVPWTWPVTGQAYPVAADVAYRQPFTDGTVIRGDVQLVKDNRGNWSWFFGRDRAFVEEQIARYGEGGVSTTDQMGSPAYAVIDLGTGSGNWSSARRINERGQVLWAWGSTQDPLAVPVTASHSMMWWSGAARDLGSVGIDYAIAINDMGSILAGKDGEELLYLTDAGTVRPLTQFDDGFAVDVNNAEFITGQIGTSGVIVNGGTIESLPVPPNFKFVQPVAINDFGHVAATAVVDPLDSANQRAALVVDGVITVLDAAPGSQSSSADDLNDVGQVAGSPGVGGMHRVHGPGRAFLYDRDTVTLTDLGTLLGYENSVASAINNGGHVVGYAWLPSNEADPIRRAFIYYHRSRIMVDLNRLIPQGSGWQLFEAFDINDARQIVGRGLIDGEMHAFLLTPTG